jgi:hypothetical protein
MARATMGPGPRLGARHRPAAQGRQFGGRRGSDGQKFVGSNHPVEEAGGAGLVGVGRFPQDGAVKLGRWHPIAGQLHGPFRQGHADSHLVESDLEIAGRPDATIRGQQHQGAGSQGMTGARRHDGQRFEEQAGDEPGPGRHQLTHGLGAGRHGRQVKPGREPARPSGQQHGPGVVRSSPVQGLAQAAQHIMGNGVGLAIIEGDERDLPLPGVGDRHAPTLALGLAGSASAGSRLGVVGPRT